MAESSQKRKKKKGEKAEQEDDNMEGNQQQQQQAKRTGKNRDGTEKDIGKYKATATIMGNKKFFATLLKAVLSLLQRMRVVEAIVLDCWMVPTESDLVQGLKNELTKYDQECKSDGRGHSNGPPDPHLWARMLEVLLEQEAVKGKDEVAKGLEAEQVRVNELGPLALDDTIKSVRLLKCYQSQHKRILLAIHRSPAYEKVNEALRMMGAVRKSGRAPMGALEEELMTWLEHTFA